MSNTRLSTGLISQCCEISRSLIEAPISTESACREESLLASHRVLQPTTMPDRAASLSSSAQGLQQRRNPGSPQTSDVIVSGSGAERSVHVFDYVAVAVGIRIQSLETAEYPRQNEE